MKKQLLALVIGLMSLTTSKAQTPADQASVVKFAIKNFGINTNGDFKGLKGKIVFDPASLSTAAFNVTVDAATVNTAMDARDNHLRREEYFDTEHYPVITIQSDRIVAGKKNGYVLYGKLTMKGTTRDISIPFSAVKKDKGWLFEGEFNINRLDYKIGKKSMTLSDEVKISLSVTVN